MKESFGFKIEKARERILGPRKIEFENGVYLETSVLNGEPSVVLKKEGESLRDLKDFAPEGTTLKFGGKWSAQAKENDELEIKIGKFKGADAVLSFLHEAGHLNKKEELDQRTEAKLRYSIEKQKDNKNAYSSERLLALGEERKMVIHSERGAWEFAIRAARELERQYGIDVFSRIGDPKKKKMENILQFVNKYLDTYELGCLEELYHRDIFTKEDMEKMFKEIEEENEDRGAGI